MPKEINLMKVYKKVQEQEETLQKRTTASKETYEIAKKCLVGGVASGYHSRVPYPIYMSHGSGSSIWDMEGNAYLA